jgi:hypothetical protein
MKMNTDKMKVMKKILVVLLVVPLSVSGISGQERSLQSSGESSKVGLGEVYSGIGLGVGTAGSTLGISASMVLDNGLGLTISRKGFIYRAKNLPHDWEGWFLPRDHVASTSLRIIYESGVLHRWGIEIGPSWINYHEISFTPRSSDGWWRTRNYNTETSTGKAMGLTIRPKIDFGDARYIGGEFAFLVNINGYKPVFGIELYLNLGMVNRHAIAKTRSYN